MNDGVLYRPQRPPVKAIQAAEEAANPSIIEQHPILRSGMIQSLPIAKAKEEISLLPGLANRHGLIAGATGTGKTVTLQKMAEAFSSIGVPVFMADVKGDLSGISQAGQMTPKLKERLDSLKLTAP